MPNMLEQIIIVLHSKGSIYILFTSLDTVDQFKAQEETSHVWKRGKPSKDLQIIMMLRSLNKWISVHLSGKF